MRGNLVQVRPGHVHPAHDEVGADVSLVAEQHLLDQPVSRDDPDLPAGVEPVQLQLAADGGRGLVTVSSSAGTSAVNIGGPATKNVNEKKRKTLLTYM